MLSVSGKKVLHMDRYVLRYFPTFHPNFQKQVLRRWIRLIDTSRGAFHQVWGSCSWWELWKGKVNLTIVEQFGFKLLPQYMKNILGTGTLTSSLSSWWPMANWSSSWSTQVTHKKSTHLKFSSVHKFSQKMIEITKLFKIKFKATGYSGQIIQKEKGKTRYVQE